MTRLTAHMVRGATAAVLIAWALLFQRTEPALAAVAGVAAVIAMRGCPACWMLGLYDTISETIKVRRASLFVTAVRRPERRSLGAETRGFASPDRAETSLR